MLKYLFLPYLLLINLAAPVAWALDAVDTRHLLDRTGFGARPADAARFAPLNREQAVASVLDEQPGRFILPEWADDRPFPDYQWLRTLPEAERMAWSRDYNRQRNEWRVELKALWYRHMLAGDAPLTERMTLFWHNHFTSALRTVSPPQLMLRQHQLLRRHALGNYTDLLRAVVTDPAMLIYLDGRRNRKQRPNENFARELLELFTLGEGHYTEADIKAAARALTGWTLDWVSGVARFNPRQHDDGEKTFLGRTGHFGADAIIAILLDQPRTAEFLVEKLWREFVSPEPDSAEVQRLAGVFRESGYEIRPLLRELLLSEAFWTADHRASLIKSPVELMVGTLYRFELPAPPERRLISFGRQMGQELLDPPDVKGWPGHTAWIDSDRLLVRERFLRGVTRDLADESARVGRAWDTLDGQTAIRLLLPLIGTEPNPAAMDNGIMNEEGVRDRLIEAILDPRFQLK